MGLSKQTVNSILNKKDVAEKRDSERRHLTSKGHKAGKHASTRPSHPTNLIQEMTIHHKVQPPVPRTTAQGISHPSVQPRGVAEGSRHAPKEDATCQTEECVTPGKLSIFLSVTNGTEASTQVVHPEMSHKVASTDGNWKRQWISWI
ncbi:hypothetical protein MTO96_018206 [Rhipicephalus appendiculatus]